MPKKLLDAALLDDVLINKNYATQYKQQIVTENILVAAV